MTNQKELRSALARELEKVYGDDRSMIDFCLKEASVIVPLSRGVLTIDKSCIEKDFCFGESGYDMREAMNACHTAETSKEYFIHENLRYLNNELEALEDEDSVYIYQGYRGRGIIEIYCYECLPLYERLNIVNGLSRGVPVRKASHEEVEAIRKGYEEEKRKFTKRLNTYLKRYGLSKVRAWTYWRDA